jgi:hypothetical protein
LFIHEAEKQCLHALKRRHCMEEGKCHTEESAALMLCDWPCGKRKQLLDWNHASQASLLSVIDILTQVFLKQWLKYTHVS